MKTRPVSIVLILGLLATPCALRAQSVLKPGDVLLICGDSITEQKQYSAFIEDYILMSQPVRDVKTIQVGWGGETARHFADSWESVVLAFAPTVATVNFGMNDGGYDLFKEEVGKGYRDSLAKAIAKFKESGVRTVLISSPGVVDSYYFKNPKHSDVTASDYNRTLGLLGDSGKDLAASEGAVFADVHSQMMSTMARVKAALGEKYPVAGNQDGVHPLPNGHLIMAYAFLKAMGFDGNIGRITWDAGTGKSEATEGHRVVSSNHGEVTIESTRYPFCFREGEASSDGTASILPFVPFNQDLNRYLLVVKNLKSPRVRITWGSESKEFSRKELEAGINLAAAFPGNPFTQPFLTIDKAVHAKQNFETIFIKGYLSGERGMLQSMPSKEDSLKSIHASLLELHTQLLADLANAVKPVVHTIKFEEVN